MPLFGYDRDRVDAAFEDGYQKMAMLQRQRDQAIAQVRELMQRNEKLERRLARIQQSLEDEKALATKAVRAIEKRDERIAQLKRRLGEAETSKRDAERNAQSLRDQVTQLTRENRTLEAAVEREEDRAQAKLAVLGQERDAAVERCEDLQLYVTELGEENTALDRRCAGLEGLVKGWAPIVLGGSVDADTDAETDADAKRPKTRKRALQEQAALARIRKTDVSPQARLRLLKDADRLGVLPADLRPALGILKAQIGEGEDPED